MSTSESTPTDASIADSLKDELKKELKEELRQEFEQELAEKNKRINELEERVEELESEPSLEINNESDPIKSLRVEGAPIGRAIESKPGETDVEDKLDELKTDLEASNPTPDAEETGSPDLYQPETPIEQVVTMPEEMAVDQLTANQERARFIATDVRDYAESVPAGWAITSTDLRRVLQAYDQSGHTETVARVFDILDDLGGDDIKIVERRGTRRLIFTDELVDRLARIDQESHDVVMEGEA
jgi:hypothetical protein